MKKSVMFVFFLNSAAAFAGAEGVYRLVNVEEKRCPEVVTYNPVVATDLLSLPAIDRGIEACDDRPRYGRSRSKRVVRFSTNEYTDTTITHQCKSWATGGDGYSGAILWRNVDSEEKNFSFDFRHLTVKYTSHGWNLLHRDCTSSSFHNRHQSEYSCQYRTE